MSDTEENSTQIIKEVFPGAEEVTRDVEQLDQEMMPPAFRELLDEANREILNWIPDRPGREVVGTLMDITDVESKFHENRDTVPMLVLQSASGALWGVRCYHSVLLDEVERRIEKGRLNIGDLVAVKYLGKGVDANRDLNQYENYRLVVKPGLSK